MIEIKETRALRGPNRYTRHTCILMVLDIKEYELKPSDKIKGFNERLLKLLPSLNDHGCSIGGTGGFVKRLETGTWAGHIIEHIALELQCLAGMEVGYGKTFTTLVKGTYVVVFRYQVESVGLKAAERAVSLFQAVAEDTNFNVDKAISELKILREQDMLGPTTWSIVKEAQLKGIPFIRLNENSHIQLGYGAHQKRIQASMTSQTSAIAVEAADEKTRIKEHLGRSGIPVPRGYLTNSEKEAEEAFLKLEGPVVVKPDIGNHGRGATINISSLKDLKIAFKDARKINSKVIVEDYVEGSDCRLLVIDGKLVAAAKRKPACITGDGVSTVKNLIKVVNEDPLRGFGHEKSLTRIDVDNMTKRLLLQKGFSLDSKPKHGEVIYLKTTANLSQGGTSEDVTEDVSPSIRLMAERAALIIGLDCVGIDVLVKDISLPLVSSGLKVVEMNAAPGFRMHLDPTVGQHRNVAKPMVDMLFPNGYLNIPVIAVTGTNGKTTTCKLIAHTLKYSGLKVGLACTTGVEIDGVATIQGDYSGPEGAKIVIREPSVNSVVLEVARGGLVRRGLGVEKVDIGILLNIGSDHMGTDWIESPEDLKLVKSTVIEAVKSDGVSVINAEDVGSMSVIDRARGNITLFSIDPQNLNFREHIENDRTGITVLDSNITILKKGLETCVCAVQDVPITLNGIIDFNTSNALAAVGALHGMGMPVEKIRNGLMTFHSSPNQNPGRMNLFDFKDYKVLIDYGHNPDAVRAIAKMLPKISKGRKVSLCHGTGNRTNEQLVQYGEALALVYDYIILTDFDPRKRPSGETVELVKKGLLKGGLKEAQIEVFTKNPEATLNHVFSKVEKGDLLVIQVDELEPVMTEVKKRHLENVTSFK